MIYFLTGALPVTALLHKRQLSLFYMIARLPHNILYQIGKYVLTTLEPSSNSWFLTIHKLCTLYNLPHPLLIMDNPPSKEKGKLKIRSHVINYWEIKLRQSSSGLTSLSYFKPEYMSLARTHPIWSTCGSNSFEVSKAIIQARMLSARYRTDKRLSYFNKNFVFK